MQSKQEVVADSLLSYLYNKGISSDLELLLEKRVELGFSKYGTKLMTLDGRNEIKDAEEEAADLLFYMWKCKMMKIHIDENHVFRELMNKVIDVYGELS